MKLKKIGVWVIAIIVFSNLPFISPLFSIFIDSGHYKYSNSDGSSTFLEFSDHTFKLAKERHRRCNLIRPKEADQKLYRLFTKNPLAFWRWRLYFYDERYKLPYREWGQIEKTRINNGDGCSQSF